MSLNVRQPLVLLGAGGHAKVLLETVRTLALPILGVCDPLLCSRGIVEWNNVRVLGDDSVLNSLDPEGVCLVNGIGGVVGSIARKEIYERTRNLGFRFPALVHPYAWVASDVLLSDGVQIMAGAIVQPGCHIGENTIINTRASVDHDVHIGAHVHVAPGATLCGGVRVGDSAFIGAGSTIIQEIDVGARSVVGAGAIVVRNLSSGHVLFGVEKRLIRDLDE